MKELYESLIVNQSHKECFVVIKPGFLDLSQKVVDIFKKHNWSIKNTTIKQLQLDEAKRLYEVHKNESFYKDLCQYMSSGPSRAFIFTKPGKYTKRTFSSVAVIKDMIRDKYGIDDMKNVLHSSDSKENMMKEAKVYFRI